MKENPVVLICITLYGEELQQFMDVTDEEHGKNSTFALCTCSVLHIGIQF